MIRVRKRAAAFQVSREMAIELGLVVPTETEYAQIMADRHRYQLWRERQEARHERGLRLLRGAGGLVRQLVDLHRPDSAGRCAGCDIDGAEAEPPPWPCRTMTDIADYYHVQLEEPWP